MLAQCQVRPSPALRRKNLARSSMDESRARDATVKQAMQAGQGKGRTMDLKDLADQFGRFRGEVYGPNQEFFQELAKGQAPKAIMIACSDSRISPPALFGIGPGDAFACRTVGALLPPEGSDAEKDSSVAALQFAIENLKVPHVYIVGHTNCGAVKALVAGNAGGDSPVGKWLENGAGAVDRAKNEVGGAADKEHLHSECEFQLVQVSMENAMTHGFLKSAVDEGRVQLHGMVYDIGNGAFHAWTWPSSRKAAAKY